MTPQAQAGFPNLAVLPPRVRVLTLVTAHLISHSMHVVAELGIADRLAQQPQTAAELADATGTDAHALSRVLGAATAVGVFRENEEGRFENTPEAEFLRSDVPGSVRDFAVHIGNVSRLHSYGELLDTVRTGETAFNRVHGQPVFDYFADKPELSAPFNRAMTSFSGHAATELAQLGPFDRFRLVADLGGGHGLMISEILKRHQNVRGLLFDRPEVVPGAPALLEKAGVVDRVSVVSGDFFNSVPDGPDAYILKSVLHDWDDAECGTILRNVRKAIGENEDARLFLIEAVMTETNVWDFSRILDLEMLVNVGGQERTERDWSKLLADNGFELVGVTRAVPPNNILECRPV